MFRRVKKRVCEIKHLYPIRAIWSRVDEMSERRCLRVVYLKTMTIQCVLTKICCDYGSSAVNETVVWAFGRLSQLPGSFRPKMITGLCKIHLRIKELTKTRC